MSRKTLSGVLVIAATAAAALSLAVPAGALENVKVSGTIQFTPPSDFHGKVNSKNADCRNGARVSLWRYDNAADTTADKLGTDKASRNGSWAIMVPMARAGEFQIQIGGRTVGEHDDQVKCKLYVGARVQF